MDKLEIRLVQVSDLMDVHALGVRVFGSLATTALTMRQLYDLSYPYIFAAYNPNLVGYCFGGLDAYGKIGHLYSLAVDPDARRQRLGYLLSEKVMLRLKEDPVDKLQVVCSPTNSSAIALYTKLGFQPGEIVKDYFGQNADRLVMSCAV